MATEMAWNQLATDLGCITPPHTIANMTELKTRQVFLPHSVLNLPVEENDSTLYSSPHIKTNYLCEA